MMENNRPTGLPTMEGWIWFMFFVALLLCDAALYRWIELGRMLG